MSINGSLRETTITDVLQLLGHPLVGGNDIVEDVGDLAGDASQV